jgi:hypothetical protein
MGWPEAIVIVVVIIGIVAFVSTVVGGNASVRAEEAKSKSGEGYRTLAADYETLARETRDAAKAIQTDLAALREKIDSIELMMREVS